MHGLSSNRRCVHARLRSLVTVTASSAASPTSRWLPTTGRSNRHNRRSMNNRGNDLSDFSTPVVRSFHRGYRGKTIFTGDATRWDRNDATRRGAASERHRRSNMAPPRSEISIRNDNDYRPCAPLSWTRIFRRLISAGETKRDHEIATLLVDPLIEDGSTGLDPR